MLTAPQERVALVRPFWERLPQDDRVRHLTLSLDDVRARAELIVERHRKQAGASTAAGSQDPFFAATSLHCNGIRHAVAYQTLLCALAVR